MMHRPWDCAQPDEWLPQSLRLCWGDSGGFGGGSGGGGFSGDSGGWGGDSGATTGGGDWGSSGSYDASGFNAGGDLGAWAGVQGYDASAPSMTGGGDWGSFGATNYAGMDAPNAIFSDIAGPNPGVTTGGGDWGSAGGFYGGGGGGGAFGDYGGGGGGGYTGGGGSYGGGGGGYYGGGGQQGGGSFGSFGTGTLGASNAVSAVSGPAFADTAGPGSLAGPAGQALSGAPTTSEAQSESAGGGETTSDSETTSSEEGDTSVAPSESQFGEPSEAAPEAEAQTDAAPEVSSTIAASRETNFDYGPSAAPAEQDAGPSSFGPESITSQEGRQALSDLTQSALAPDEGYYQGSPYATLAPADVNWGAMFEAPSDPGYQPDAREGPMGPIADPGWFQSIISDIPGVTTPAWAQDFGKSLADVNTWLAPQNQGAINYLSTLNWDPSTWANVAQPWTAFDQQAAGEQGKAGQIAGDLASQLGLETVGDTQGVDPGSEQYGTEAYAPGGIDPSAEQYGVINQQDLASQLGIENLDTTPWGSVFEAPELAPDYASVFEAPAQDPWGSVFEGAPSVDPSVDPTSQIAPTVDVTSPTVDTTMESGQPGAPPTTDDASTPGGDPALSGAAAAAAGAPGQLGQPATAPAQGGQTFVSETAVSAIANATSNAALDVGAPPQVGDAASQAAHNAALNLNSPAEIAAAASEAALANGATQAQADAIAAAALNAANSQTAFTPGPPAQQEQAPPGQQQPGAPEGEQTTSTTSAFIPGGLQTNFEYALSQPAPQSLIDMAPAQPGQPQAQPGTTSSITGGRTTDFNYPSATSTGIDPGAEQYGVEPDDHDTPEPPDTSPPQDPNAPRPPGNIPGQLIGARDNYPNSQLDNPRNPFYRDSGRTDYPQGRPGVTYRTARQAGVEPNFHVGDYNVQDLDARLIENINRAIVDMERAGIPNTLTVSSAYRPMTRAEALERGMDPRTSQESVYARGNAPGGRHFAAARPGGSNHAPGRAIDFNPGLSGRALSWLRANAGHYGLETLGSKNGKPFDVPHIQLQGARGIANVRPSAQEQAQQRALDAQTREANAGRGQAPTQQAAPPSGGWRGIGSDRSDIAWTEQPDVARPPADIPVPTNLPPQPPQETRPPADIPAPAPRGPNEFDIPVTAPVRNATVIANNILKQATAHLNINSTTEALNAAGVVAAKAMAAAGIPANLARSLMLKGALDGAIANGYGPGGSRSTVMGFSIWGKVQSTITESIDAAMQGYQPAKPGELRGPPAPAQQRSDLSTGQQFADLSQSLGRIAPSGMTGRPGEIGSQQPMFSIPGLDRLSPITAPPPPPDQPVNPREQASLFDTRFLAKGGHVDKDEPVVVGEEGPEYFVPDQPGTVFPHQPQPGMTGKSENIDRWPKIPAPKFPGHYGGVEREILRQTREAQDPLPSLIDMVNSGRLPLNAANWHRLINNPSLIALGRSRMDDRRAGIDPGAEQYGTEQPGPVLPVGTYIPTPAPAADPTNPLAQALGYGSIRRPMRIGRQSYQR